jgi:hypothetical protein
MTNKTVTRRVFLDEGRLSNLLISAGTYQFTSECVTSATFVDVPNLLTRLHAVSGDSALHVPQMNGRSPTDEYVPPEI